MAAAAWAVGLCDYGGDFDVGCARRWMKVGRRMRGAAEEDTHGVAPRGLGVDDLAD